MVMNCFPSPTILSFHRRKIFSEVQRPLQIIRGQGLPECISPQQTVEDTPKYFAHVMRFDLKLSVAMLLTEEKCKAIFWLTAQIKHWGGWKCFWKPIAGGLVRSDFHCHYCHRWRNLMRKMAGSPLEIQINFAHPLSKSFSKPISMSEFAQSSWQRTFRGRCNHLNYQGKEAGQ